MSNEYYIISEQGYSGPYELVALVIKIRNGSLAGSAQIQRSDSQDIKQAREWDELKEFFAAVTAASGGKKETGPKNLAKKLHLNECLHNGLNFLQQNYISTVFSGLLILIVTALTAAISFSLPDNAHVVGYILGFITLYFLLSCYMFMILRMTRGQQINPGHILKKVQPVAFSLLRASLLIVFPVIAGIILFTSFEDDLIVCLIGLLIIIIPGIYVISIFSFAPLLIIDRGYGVWEALSASRTAVMKSGWDNFGVYFALNMINLIAALFMIFPMAVTLPVTISAITESYDELFS